MVVAGRLRTNVWTKDGTTYERLTLEATTVGHDLTRGTATFFRAIDGEPDRGPGRHPSVRCWIGWRHRPTDPTCRTRRSSPFGELGEEDSDERIDADGVIRQVA